MTYDRAKAISYALIWWNSRNPLFYDFENIGGDCTNFVSQCLLYGGLKMHYNEWFFRNINHRSPSWSGVNEFCNFLLTNQVDTSPIGVLSSISQVTEGDIVQLTLGGHSTFHHSMLITKINHEKEPSNRTFDDIFITCHTVDAKNVMLSAYDIKDIRFIKILN